MRTKASAAAANGRIALDLKWIEIMPDLVDKIADALGDSNLTVLNGSEGLSELMAGFIVQAAAVYEAAKRTTAEGGSFDATLDGAGPAAVAQVTAAPAGDDGAQAPA